MSFTCVLSSCSYVLCLVVCRVALCVSHGPAFSRDTTVTLRPWSSTADTNWTVKISVIPIVLATHPVLPWISERHGEKMGQLAAWSGVFSQTQKCRKQVGHIRGGTWTWSPCIQVYLTRLSFHIDTGCGWHPGSVWAVQKRRKKNQCWRQFGDCVTAGGVIGEREKQNCPPINSPSYISLPAEWPLEKDKWSRRPSRENGQ